MLSAKYKINRKFFPDYRDQKVVWSGAVLRLCCYLPKQSNVRFAVVVSNKQFKTHVSKNRFKRSVYEFIGGHKHVFETLPFGKLIVYPIKNIESVVSEDIDADLSTFLSSHVAIKHNN